MKIGNETALIVVDAQRDFVSGSLAVPGAREAMDGVDALVRRFYQHRLPIAYTADRHPPDHCSFSEQGGLWPPHCVAGTLGSAIVALVLDKAPFVVEKGTDRHRDAYSGFDGAVLNDWLDGKQIDRVVVCGLATDYCVKATAIDAARLGFEVVVVVDAVAAVTEVGRSKALSDMVDRGVRQRTVRWIEVVE